MQNFTIPDQNVFDEKAKAFLESKQGKRLAEKYQVKPFEVRWKPAQIFARIGSFVAHGIVILASSTFVFTYFNSLFSKLPYPFSMVLALAICSVILFGIEWFKRSNSHELFKAFFQFGMQTEQGLRVFVMVVLMFMSALFCYFGGFDFVELVSTPPTYQTPQQKDIATIRNDYKGLINKAEQEAERYRTSKLYKGKLADEHAIVYKKLLDAKNALQGKMLAQIEKDEADNQNANKTALKAFEDEKQAFQNKTTNRGRGLAHVSIVFDVLLFLFVWFLEFYDWKTVIQYAGVPTTKTQEPTDKTQGTTTLSNATNHTPTNDEKSTIQATTNERLPIGFYTPQQRENHKKNLWQQQLTHTTTTIKVYDDRYTIEHNGKRYNMARLNNFINEYQNRIGESKKKIKQVNLGKSQSDKQRLEKTLQKREETLNYWLSRRNELLEKINNKDK